MLKNLNKRLRGQSTAEYALLITFLIASVIAMQKWTQRALQGRLHDASVYMVQHSNELGNTLQFEPQYLTTNFTVNRLTGQTTRLGTNEVGSDENSTIGRLQGGFQAQDYTGSEMLP